MSLGINDLGEVVGTSLTADGAIHAFLWKGQVKIDLQDDFASPEVVAQAINDSGQIVGFDRDPATGRPRLFIWQLGTVEYLGRVGGTGGGVANDINDAGQVFGFSFDAAGIAEAFLWENGVMTNLGSLGNGAYPQAVNSRGWLAGFSYPKGWAKAALWKNGRIINLGTAGGRASGASDVNASGLIVGSTSTTTNSTATRAFRWKEKC